MLRYGVANELAEKAISAGLTATKARALSQKDMTERYGLSRPEARTLSNAVRRAPIAPKVVQSLLERSNYLCNICKGQKSLAYIIHHIEEYGKSQDNAYDNLVVLCPADHDLAHRGGLTLGITEAQLRRSKHAWEKQVEISNAQRAAQAIEVRDDAIDYVNIKRIEELCVRLFKKIPATTLTSTLRLLKILGPAGRFDQKHVQTKISGGRYLFDYTNCHETEHYKQLLRDIARVIDFVDLDTVATRGFDALKRSEGQYAYFIGGVCAKRPRMPITASTPTILLRYSRKKLRIEWILDPIYLMSMSAITRIGGKNRYIIYCLVRTVEKGNDGVTLVKASPLMIAQPAKYVNKAPSIAGN